MEDRTRNLLIGIIVLFAVLGAGSTLILPYLNSEADRSGSGMADHARGRRLMGEGKFGAAQSVFQQVMEQHPGSQAAARAQADKEHGIPYYQAVRMAQAGQTGQARAILSRVAREGTKTEWGPKATAELRRLGQGDHAAAEAPGQSREARLAQANSLLDQGRTEEARTIFQGLVRERGDDAAGAAANLALTTLQAADNAVRSDPAVARAHVALHRARASLLAYRGANGQYPPSLQDRGLERFGFTYRDLLGDVQRVESYRPEAGDRFEITAVARDPRGTRVRATDRAVEDLP